VLTQLVEPEQVVLPAAQVGAQKPFEHTAHGDPSPTGPESTGPPPESVPPVVASPSPDPASSGGCVEESAPGTLASTTLGGPPSSGAVFGGPASSLPVAIVETVVPSAIIPWLKCVTCALTLDPDAELGRTPNVVELGFVHRNTGELPSLVYWSVMVTGLLKTRPGGPN
jgi:hypothetical protein